MLFSRGPSRFIGQHCRQDVSCRTDAIGADGTTFTSFIYRRHLNKIAPTCWRPEKVKLEINPNGIAVTFDFTVWPDITRGVHFQSAMRNIPAGKMSSNWVVTNGAR